MKYVDVRVLGAVMVVILLSTALGDIITYNHTQDNESSQGNESTGSIITYNQTEEGANGSNNPIPNTTNESKGGLFDISVNLSDVGKALGNMTKTGVEPIDEVTKFLSDASPFLILVIGILLLVLSGFGKTIGIILVVLALIRLLWMLWGGG